MLYGRKPGEESGIICQTVGELFCSLIQIAAVDPAGEKLCLDVDGSLDVGRIGIFIVVEVRKNLPDRTAAVSRLGIGSVEIEADLFQLFRKLCFDVVKAERDQNGAFGTDSRKHSGLFSLDIRDEGGTVAALSERLRQRGVFLVGAGGDEDVRTVSAGGIELRDVVLFQRCSFKGDGAQLIFQFVFQNRLTGTGKSCKMRKPGRILQQQLHAAFRIGAGKRDMKCCVKKLPVCRNSGQKLFQHSLTISNKKNIQRAGFVPVRIKRISIQKIEERQSECREFAHSSFPFHQVFACSRKELWTRRLKYDSCKEILLFFRKIFFRMFP